MTLVQKLSRAAALLMLGFVSTSACLAFTDKSICGLWKTTIQRTGGNIVVEWKISASGDYTVTSFGPNGKQSESGRITTEGNHYFKTTNIGPDNGTFSVSGNNLLSTVGRFGSIDWTRIDGQASSQNMFPSVYGRSSAQNNGSYQQTNGYDPEMNPRGSKWAQMGFGQEGTTKDTSGWKQKAKNLLGGVAGAAGLGDVVGSYGGSGGYNDGSGGGGGGYHGSGGGYGGGGDLKSLLFSNFPLRGGSDEVEQFALPALGKAAAGGMRKRDFRLIQ